MDNDMSLLQYYALGQRAPPLDVRLRDAPCVYSYTHD